MTSMGNETKSRAGYYRRKDVARKSQDLDSSFKLTEGWFYSKSKKGTGVKPELLNGDSLHTEWTCNISAFNVYRTRNTYLHK